MILALSSLLVAGLTACGVVADGVDCDGNVTMRNMRVALPPSASDVKERCSSGFNPTYRATFTMLPDDLITFQRGTRLTEWQTEVADRAVLEEEAGDARALLFSEHSDGNYSTEVLIDIGSPERFVVHYWKSFVD